MTGLSDGLPSVLGATLRDKCFLAKNSKLDTLYQFAHPNVLSKITPIFRAEESLSFSLCITIHARIPAAQVSILASAAFLFASLLT